MTTKFVPHHKGTNVWRRSIKDRLSRRYLRGWAASALDAQAMLSGTDKCNNSCGCGRLCHATRMVLRLFQSSRDLGNNPCTVRLHQLRCFNVPNLQKGGWDILGSRLCCFYCHYNPPSPPAARMDDTLVNARRPACCSRDSFPGLYHQTKTYVPQS